VTSSHEGSTTVSSLVDGAVVVLIVLDIFFNARLKPNHRCLHEENLGITLVQAALLVVPLATLDEHTVDIYTVLRWHRVLILDDLKIEDQTINSDSIFTGIILNSTSQETLSEVELVDPVERRKALIDPGLEELESLLEICDITSKGLEGGITLSLPESRHFTVKK